MTRRPHFTVFVLVLSSLAQLDAYSAELKVNLFGQPCVLKGSADEATLKAIHAISPEQMPPAETEDQAKKVLDRIKKSAAVPSELDLYKERLTRHYEAQVALYEGLAAAKKAGKVDAFLNEVKTYVPAKRMKEFEIYLRGVEAKEKPASWSSMAIDQVSENYRAVVEQRPEEDFHRAINRMKIHYNCTFEEGAAEENAGE